MVIFGDNTQNTLVVRGNVFIDNVAPFGGGAIIMTFFSTGLQDAPHTTNITDCYFHGNSGESGGAVLLYLAYEGNTVKDACGRRCKCQNGKLVDCCRVRVDFASLTVNQRRSYIDTVLRFC